MLEEELQDRIDALYALDRDLTEDENREVLQLQIQLMAETLVPALPPPSSYRIMRRVVWPYLCIEDKYWNRGKALQREYYDQIPFKTEYEHCAGYYDLVLRPLLVQALIDHVTGK